MLVDHIVKAYMKYRMEKIMRFRARPIHYQKQVFNSLLRKASRTQYGRRYKFDKIKSYTEFRDSVPLVSYEALWPWIDRAMRGEKNVLWPGRTKYFSKSSGTSNARSKYIPVTSENLRKNHIAGSWDAMTILYHHHPDVKVFHKKNLVLGGSLEKRIDYPKAVIGDISALMIDNMPGVARPFFVPKPKVSLMPDWEEKIEAISEIAISTPDIVLFGGVPTWNLVLFQKILEKTGKKDLTEIWPDLKVYFHGGVGFAPYRASFEKLIPRDDLVFLESYNASEGLFAIQDVLHQDLGLLLLLDRSIFFEFIPLEYYEEDERQAIPLWEVEKDRDYVIVISTNAGLWRYIPGDVIRFSSIFPYRIKVSGRTKQYINAFGEELMIHNVDEALGKVCPSQKVQIANYTVAPKYIDGGQRGRHQWYIEFAQAPKDIDRFARRLDHQLRKINSDYDAKRTGGLALDCLEIYALPSGTFDSWLKGRVKLGSQSKIPRLANDRRFVDQLIPILEAKSHGEFPH